MRVIHVEILLMILEKCNTCRVPILTQKLRNCFLALTNNSFRFLVTFPSFINDLLMIQCFE